MIEQIKKTLITNSKAIFVVLLIVAATLLIQVEFVAAASTSDGANQVIAGAGEVDDGTGGATSITKLINTTINVLSWIAGVVSVIMIIISGLRISVANGDSGKISGARNAIIYSLVGLMVVIFAQVMVRFVLTNVGT